MNELLRFGLIYKFEFNAPVLIIGYLSVIAAGYLLGGLSADIIIKNIRGISKKNAAVITFFFDGVKIVAAVFAGVIFFGNNTESTAAFAGVYAAGLACIAGIAFPVYYKFKGGGKGAAAVLFMVLCTAPPVALICFLIFAVIALWTKYISLGVVMAVMVYPMILNRITGVGAHNLIAIVIMLLVLFLHRDNIKKLGAGKENKFDFKIRKKIKKDKEDT
ncbi:MAG: glycerol-3-phosphate acyltransferase [Oscillospiraceae bacterium]|nr:glycerol-3-phosphate acyltransferase [Oscillospiraceae bacterium]